MNDWEKKSFKNLLPKHLGLSLTGQVNWNNRNSATSFLLLKSMTGITVYLCCRKKQFLNALSNRDISIQLTIPICCKSRKKTMTIKNVEGRKNFWAISEQNMNSLTKEVPRHVFFPTSVVQEKAAESTVVAVFQKYAHYIQIFYIWMNTHIFRNSLVSLEEKINNKKKYLIQKPRWHHFSTK